MNLQRHGLKIQGQKNKKHAHINQEKTEAAISISEKVHSRKRIWQNRHFKMTEMSISQEERAILNVNTLNNSSSKYLKQKLKELKRNKPMRTTEDFNTSVNWWKNRHKKSR